MGENGVAREQIHTKRCHFMSVLVLVLIHKQLPGFLFFSSFFFSPSQDARGELESRRSVPVTESLRAAATPLPLLWHVFPSVAAIRSVSRLLWGDQRSARGWGGCPRVAAAAAEMRWNANALISVRLGRPRENQPSSRQVFVRRNGRMDLDFPKNGCDACTHATLLSWECVCVSLLLLGIELYIMKKSPRTRTISQCSRVSNGECLFVF